MTRFLYSYRLGAILFLAFSFYPAYAKEKCASMTQAMTQSLAKMTRQKYRITYKDNSIFYKTGNLPPLAPPKAYIYETNFIPKKMEIQLVPGSCKIKSIYLQKLMEDSGTWSAFLTKKECEAVIAFHTSQKNAQKSVRGSTLDFEELNRNQAQTYCPQDDLAPTTEYLKRMGILENDKNSTRSSYGRIPAYQVYLLPLCQLMIPETKSPTKP